MQFECSLSPFGSKCCIRGVECSTFFSQYCNKGLAFVAWRYNGSSQSSVACRKAPCLAQLNSLHTRMRSVKSSPGTQSDTIYTPMTNMQVYSLLRFHHTTLLERGQSLYPVYATSAAGCSSRRLQLNEGKTKLIWRLVRLEAYTTAHQS